MDGRSLFTLFRNPKSTWRSALVIERGPPVTKKGRPAAGGAGGEVFTAIRTPRYLYAQYANGEQELYDLAQDPYELQSRHADPAYAQVRSSLAARLAVLKSCASAACRQH
jgi:hypothetical protein